MRHVRWQDRRRLALSCAAIAVADSSAGALCPSVSEDSDVVSIRAPSLRRPSSTAAVATRAVATGALASSPCLAISAFASSVLSPRMGSSKPFWPSAFARALEEGARELNRVVAAQVAELTHQLAADAQLPVR